MHILTTLRNGRFVVPIPAETRDIFSPHQPHRYWDPHSSLFNGHRASVFWVCNGGVNLTNHLRLAQMLKMSTAIILPPPQTPTLYTFIVWTGTSLLIYPYIHGEVYPEDGGNTFSVTSANVYKHTRIHMQQQPLGHPQSFRSFMWHNVRYSSAMRSQHCPQDTGLRLNTTPPILRTDLYCNVRHKHGSNYRYRRSLG